MRAIIDNIQKSKFLKDFLTTFGSNISVLGVGIIGSMITVRYLGAEGMGLYTILTSFSLFFVSLAEMGVRQSNIYFIAKDDSNLNNILSADLIIWVVSSILGISIFLGITYYKEINVPYYLIIVASLIIPINVANTFLNGVMVGSDKISKNSKINFLNGLTKLVTIIFFIVLLELNVLGALIVLITPTLTNIYRKYIFLKAYKNIKIKFQIHKDLIMKLINHGILYGVALFLMTNQKMIPIFVMADVLPQHQIGIYGVGLTFAGLVYQIFSAVAPIIFVKSAKSKDPIQASLDIQKLMRVMFVMLIAVSAVIAILIKYVLLILYGAEFIESSNVTRIMLLGIIFYNVFLVLNMDMAGKGKPWVAIYTLIPITIINLSLNYFFIDRIGIVGAAASTSASMALASFIYLFLYSKQSKVSIKEIITPRKSDWNFINKFFKPKKNENL